MVKKNSKGGKKHRRGKKGDSEPIKVNAPLKKDGQAYAFVTKMLGNRRIMAKLTHQLDESQVNQSERLCIIPGKFKRRVWINKGDIILVGTRDGYSDNKCDVMYKYTPAEAKQLVKQGEIPEHLLISPDMPEEEDNQGDVFFVDGDQDSEEDEFTKFEKGFDGEINLEDL